jgi:Zn-dependent metalloprotease
MKKLIPAILLAAVCSVDLSAQIITRDTKDNTIESLVYNDNEGFSAENIENALFSLLELDPSHTLKLKYTNPAGNGVVVNKYQQWYNNIPVEHGTVTVMLKGNKATYVNANIFKPVQALNTVPAISEAQALDIALNLVNAKEYMWQAGELKGKINSPFTQQPVATLVWVEDFGIDELDKQLHLAYRFEIFAKEPMSNDRIYIDAVTGKVLLKDPVMKHVAATGTAVYSGNVSFETTLLSPGTYSLEDVARKVYTYNLQSSTNFGLAVDFTNSTTTWGKDYSIDAHWGMTKVFDYWKNEHNRTSYDGAGSNMVSFLNYDISYNNAFWTGDFMVYGSGTGMFNSGFEPLVSLDVCSHELGHGICEYTAGLVYSRESGAMNEGFSDIWGAVVENYAAPDKQMWSMGEELRVGALRSMSNPNLYTDPDCHSGTHWVNVIGCNPTGGNDYCGVHTNSGVLNYWFYLLTVGGKGKNDLNNDFEVAGIGVSKAADITYATELVLNSTDDYADCRTASINAAVTLYGNCSREVEAVTRAWHAVGVGSAFAPCTPQIAFAFQDTVVNKIVPGVVCPSSKTISIPLRVIGTPVGGNATVTVSGMGNVNGGDYAIVNNTLTFNAGSTAPQNVQVNILDNGDVATDKMLKLYFTITPNGSNAAVGYTYDTCYITILGSRITPDTDTSIVARINNADVKSKAITPFFSRNALARTQFIIKAEELHLAGIQPNVPVTALEFNVTEKNSAQPFTNFRLKIAHTTIDDLGAGNPTVNTVYHQSNYSTQLGWNRLAFSTPLVWNGTDNLAIETCFTNTTAGSENDYIQGVGTNNYGTTVAHAGSGSDGCNLSFSSGFNYFSISKPVVRLVQSKQPLSVEKIIAGSRPWEVHPGQNIFFHNDTNGKLMGNIANTSTPLGCTNVFIVAQGNGFKPLGTPFASANRSLKEFSLLPSQNASTANYEFTLYFDISELSGTNLANIRVLATSALHDSLMTVHNTQQVVPAVAQTNNSYSFKGQFTGTANRYFLADNHINLPNDVAALQMNSGSISVVNNPFTDKIYIQYQLAAATKAQVKLYDITGKILVQQSNDFQAGQHNTILNTGEAPLVPGNYIIQIITDTEVFMQKMVKQ